MKKFFPLFFLLPLFSASGKPKLVKETVVEMKERTEAEFCSGNSKEEANKRCRYWVSKQNVHLGDRMLTTRCLPPVPGKEAEKCKHKVVGRITYITKKITREYQ